MKLMIESSLAMIGTNAENNEKQNLMGALGLYVLYRTLLPRKQQPDMKLHRKTFVTSLVFFFFLSFFFLSFFPIGVIWGVQKTLPLIIISENVMFKIGEFLMSYVPVDSATAKKLDPSQPDLARSQYLERFDNAFNGKAQLLLGQCKAWMILAESRIQSSICHEISGQTANGKIISRIIFLFLFSFSLHVGLPFSP
jgi:hypothetical protein